MIRYDFQENQVCCCRKQKGNQCFDFLTYTTVSKHIFSFTLKKKQDVWSHLSIFVRVTGTCALIQTVFNVHNDNLFQFECSQ